MEDDAINRSSRFLASHSKKWFVLLKSFLAKSESFWPSLCFKLNKNTSHGYSYLLTRHFEEVVEPPDPNRRDCYCCWSSKYYGTKQIVWPWVIQYLVVRSVERFASPNKNNFSRNKVIWQLQGQTDLEELRMPRQKKTDPQIQRLTARTTVERFPIWKVKFLFWKQAKSWVFLLQKLKVALSDWSMSLF